MRILHENVDQYDYLRFIGPVMVILGLVGHQVLKNDDILTA